MSSLVPGLLVLLVGCADGAYRRPLMTPEAAAPYEINTGFTELGTAPSMGHTVPLEGEIISTPPGASEKAGQEPKK